MNKLKMPLILTYRSESVPKPSLTWVAAFYQASRGEIVQYAFSGETEEEAKEKAQSWWEKCDWTTQVVKFPADDENATDTVVEKAEKHKSGKGAVFVGKVWVCHVSLPSKRIDESEFADYQAQGYIRGKKFGLHN